MTLSEFYALDPLAMWAALPAERQAAIIGPLLTAQFAEVCAEDDGTDCSDDDQCTAARISHAAFQAAMDAIEAAFPAILDSDPTALHVFSTSMLDADGTMRVRDHPDLYRVAKVDRSVFAEINGARVPIGGFKDASRPGEPPRWEAWTESQVEAERLRRHPDQSSEPSGGQHACAA